MLASDQTEVDLQELWNGVVEQVSGDAPQHRAFLNLTKPLGLIKSEAGSNLLLSAPNVFAKDVLESRLRSVLNDSLSQKIGDRINIAVTVAENIEVIDEPGFDIEFDANAPRVGTGRQESAPKSSEQSQLNPRYIFETFVIGASNRFAHAAAVAVAEAPAKAYNPLFIYGESGLGKTHLLHAIGAYAKELYGGLRVRYVSSEEFTNDFINSIRDDKASVFQRRYRDLDVLLVDDIQFFAKKNRTQEEFFYLFNALTQSKKQVIMTCDTFPKEISGMEDRLVSRFGSGLTVAIEPPELEMRVAILLKKAETESLSLPEEVAFFVANHIQSNVRELEGALKRISAFSSFTGDPISTALAKEALKDLLAVQSRLITVEHIQKCVAEYYKLKVSDMFSKKRARSVARPRQVAMALSKELTNLSLPDIGEAFGGRDHTTVLHACRKVNELRQSGSDTNRDFNALIQILRA